MSVRKYIFFVVLLTGVITLWGYYYLGGFSERNLETVEVNGYQLVGIRYQGKLNTPEMEEVFFEVQQQAQTGAPAGTMAIIVLKEPLTAKDSTDQYIGILIEEPVATLPQGWEFFSLEASKAVRSTIRAHNLVMPSPKEIREEIHAYARENKLRLWDEISIEKYLGERHLEVEIPLQEQ